MDDEQLLELLTQIQELAGVAIDSLVGEQAPGGPDKQEQPPAEEPPA
jgi:hypothetical protein